MALAYLLEVHAGGSTWELPLGAEMWSPERIARLADQAREWLNGPQRE